MTTVTPFSASWSRVQTEGLHCASVTSAVFAGCLAAIGPFGQNINWKTHSSDTALQFASLLVVWLWRRWQNGQSNKGRRGAREESSFSIYEFPSRQNNNTMGAHALSTANLHERSLTPFFPSSLYRNGEACRNIKG